MAFPFPLHRFKHKVVIRVLFAGLLLLLIAYALWEAFWYQRVGLRVVKWHTHLVEYAYVWAVGIFIFQLLFHRKGFTERAKNAFLLFTSVVFTLAVLEAFLELSGTYKNHMEKVAYSYDSPYTPQDKSYYHVWPNSKFHTLKRPEFTYPRPTNSLGFPDIEWRVAKKPGEKRILAQGDSFTEGDGAPYDSTYVSLLKQKLNKVSGNFYVMNAGVCGSDPFNNYINFRDLLGAYKPDIIIQALATNDLTDIIFRGGMERFQKDGTQKFTAAPWWEPIYALSYISRIFFTRAGYSILLRKGELSSDEAALVNYKVIGLFKTYADLCRERNIRLVVVLRPDNNEIVQKGYYYDFAPILTALKANRQIQVIDLLPAYQACFTGTHTDGNDYYWKQDGHHNSRGYAMMAQCIYDSVEWNH
jgi:lysophospholipase L1-like esterase